MSAFAPRYANALADVVVQDKLDIAQVQQQLEDFAATFAGSKDLREALLNPAIALEKRVAILDAVNRRIGLNATVRNFVAVLMAHDD
jgi:F-type H+-transporting ATPase subunit delta